MLRSRLIKETLEPLLSAPPSPIGGGPLNFVMQHQEQRNWCWAAVTASVSDYYRHTSNSLQCDVVNLERSRNDCCINGSSVNCDAVGPLDRPLKRNNNLRLLKSGTTPRALLLAEINGGRPLGCRVAWLGGGAHFLVLCGFSERLVNGVLTTTIDIADPWYGQSSQNLATFPVNYQARGTWTHSYFTKP